MSAKKKKPPPRGKGLNRQSRLASAKRWLLKFEGKNIVKGYRKHYGADWLCAVKELEMLGFELNPDYVNKLKCSMENQRLEKQALKQRRKREQLQELYKDSDPTFAFIAGYTSWGFPYGVTWEEIGEEPPDFDGGQVWHPLRP